MKIHVVRQGDTLLDLTQKYNVPLERILEVNPDMNDDIKTLEVGAKVRIPTGKISLQRNSSSKADYTEEKSEPIFKEPSPKLVDTTTPESDSVYAEHEPAHDTVTENTPSDHLQYAQPAYSPMPNEYGHTWSHYANYYPAVSHYPSPEFMPPSYYPVNYAPPFVPPYYQPMPPVPSPPALAAHINGYYPQPTAHASAGYPECVPCYPCYEENPYSEHTYSEEPWKR